MLKIILIHLLNMSYNMNNSVLLKLYKNLVLTRSVNQIIVDFAKKGKFESAVFNEIGQEAGGVGICSFLDKNDYLLPSYRDYSYVLSKGISLNEFFGEHFSKKTGYCNGLGGGFRFFSFPKKIIGPSVSIGANFSIAVGFGMGLKKKNKKNICVSVFGDGAASRGTFYSSLNISALWKLPILWVCENNQYFMNTHVSKTHPVKNIADKADGFGIYKKVVDGNNVVEIYEVAQEMIKRMRSKGGPVFLELKTYRVNEHRVNEDDLLRDEEEIKKWKQKDPLNFLTKILLAKKIINKTSKNKIFKEIDCKIKKAIEFSKKSSCASFKKYA